MPSIDDFKPKEEKKKKFKKTPYRPWDENISNGERPLKPLLNNTLEEEKKVIHNPKENQKQTVNKQDTNGKQTVNKQDTNGKQTVNKQDTNGKQTVNKQNTNGKQTVNNWYTNGKQNEISQNFSEDENRVFSELKKLCGLQKNILLYIVTKCISNKSLCSGEIKKSELEKNLNTDKHSIKTSIQRIKKKGFILKKEGKQGKGGFMVFYIENSLKNVVLKEIQDTFFKQQNSLTVNKQDTNGKQTVNNWYTSSLTSSSSNILTTTTKEAVDNFFENSLEEDDISPLKKIGFSKNHLTQILKTGKLDFEDVRLSIQHFAFDLEENKKHEKINGSPLNYFMGILLKGIPYNAPENYEDPQKKALKEFIQRKEKEKKETEALEEKAVDLMYQDWVKTISEDLIAEIIPEPQYRAIGSPFREGGLKKYFKENVYASLK